MKKYNLSNLLSVHQYALLNLCKIVYSHLRIRRSLADLSDRTLRKSKIEIREKLQA